MGTRRMVTTIPADTSGAVALGKWADLPVDSMELTAALLGGTGSLVLSRPLTNGVIQLGQSARLHLTIPNAEPDDASTVALSPGDAGDLPFNFKPATFPGAQAGGREAAATRATRPAATAALSSATAPPATTA